MNTRQRFGALLFVALGLLAAFAGRRKALVLAPARVEAPMSVRTNGGMILVAKLVADPFVPAKVRGAALRDKGEAFGGGARGLVEVSTGALASR